MDFATYQNLIQQSKNGTDDNVIAKFYDRSVKTDKMDDNGLPLFKTVCYCEIRIKDNTTEIFDQPATQDKKERFPIEYARYELNKKQTENGTPLEQFAFLDVSEIDSCKYRGIFTVEALAELSEQHASELGLSKECKYAQSFVAANKKMKEIVDCDRNTERLKQKIAQLENELQELKRTKSRRRK